MDIFTFQKHAALSRPLTRADSRNLKRLALRPHVRDVRAVMEHLIRRGWKLEQEAIYSDTTKQFICHCEGVVPEAISHFRGGDGLVPRSDTFGLRITAIC